MAGILLEKEIMARNVDSLVKSAKATINVDGGGLVVLGALDPKNKVVHTATAPAATTDKVYMAYDPSERITPVVINGRTEYYAGLSSDPRAYTNLANRVFDVFKPMEGDTIGILMEGVEGTTAPKLNDVLEPTVGKTTLTINATPTEGATQWKVIDVTVWNFPQAGIGMQQVPLYVLQCINA